MRDQSEGCTIAWYTIHFTILQLVPEILHGSGPSEEVRGRADKL